MATIQQIRPMLQARSIAETVSFYQDKLGFTCDGTWGHDPAIPSWCSLSLDGVGLMFFQELPHTHDDGEVHVHEGEPTMTGSIYFNVDDVDAVWSTVQGKSLTFEWEPQTFIHGMREFGLRDLNGYLLIFGSGADQ